MPVQQVKAEPVPLSWEGLLTLGPVILVAVLGGIANFFRKVSKGHIRPYNIPELIGECFIAGFAGMCAFWVVHSWMGNAYMEAATVGICGHAGSRAIFWLENFLTEKAGIKAASLIITEDERK